MEKEEHLRNLLDNLMSLKARRLGRREDIKQLNCSKVLMKQGIRNADYKLST